MAWWLTVLLAVAVAVIVVVALTSMRAGAIADAESEHEAQELEMAAVATTNGRTDRRVLLRPGGPLELVGRTEAAAILGVERSNLTIQVGLPEPVVDYLAAGKLWLRRDIEAFAAVRRRR
jgi:hypothetical protein